MNVNNNASKREKNIITSGNSNILKIEKKIEELKKIVNSRDDSLRVVINTHTNIKNDKTDVNGSLKSALNYFDNEIQMIQNEIIVTKERELIYDSTDITTEGNPEEDIAVNVLSKVNQISATYSKIEKFMEISEISDLVTTKHKSIKQKDIFRTIEKIWIYPVAGNNNNNFKLSIVAKFTISSNSDSKSSNYNEIFNKYKRFGYFDNINKSSEKYKKKMIELKKKRKEEARLKEIERKRNEVIVKYKSQNRKKSNYPKIFFATWLRSDV